MVASAKEISIAKILNPGLVGSIDYTLLVGCREGSDHRVLLVGVPGSVRVENFPVDIRLVSDFLVQMRPSCCCYWDSGRSYSPREKLFYWDFPLPRKIQVATYATDLPALPDQG